MNPAVEYLTRTKIIRAWFNTPCSIFLENRTAKVIVTIDKGKTTDSLRIKKWFLVDCDKENLLPPFQECVIKEKEVFNHPSVIVNGYKPIPHKIQTVPSHFNSYHGPMSEELYCHFFDNSVNGIIHQKHRKIWLWKQFTAIYLPELCALQTYISEYGSEADLLQNQMEIVEYHFQKIWQSWKKWENYFLNPMPGELIFTKEYGML